MSASPVPPVITNLSPLAPTSAGICIVKSRYVSFAAARPVLATPLLRFVLGGGVVPLAASTAALALRMPAPIGCEGVLGNARAVDLINASICAGVFGVGATACISATTPATCGVAIDVPL